MQYHPELAPGEIAVALRRQASDLIDAGLADTTDDVEMRAAQLDALQDEPDRRSIHWSLGIDAQFAQESNRHIELSNFLNHLVEPNAGPRSDQNPASADLCSA